MYNKEPTERFTVRETFASIKELGAIGLGALVEVVKDTADAIDTRLANRLNGADDES